MITADLWNIVPLIMVILTTFISIFLIWGQPLVPGFKIVVILLLVTACWALCYIFEMASVELEQQLFWNKIELLNMTAIPMLIMILGLHYSNKYQKLSFWQVIFLCIEPFLLLLLFWIIEKQEPTWNKNVLIHFGAWLPLMRRQLNLPFLIYIASSYLLLSGGVFLMVNTYIHTLNVLRRQAILVFVAIVIIFSGDLLTNLNLNPFPGIDLMIYTITIALIIAVVGLFGHYLPIVPIARSTIMKSMNDAVIVLNSHYQIVDLNTAAEKFLGFAIQQAIGQPILNYLPVKDALNNDNLSLIETEIVLEKAGQEYFFNVRISPLFTKRSRPFGFLVVIRDLSEKKRIELLQRKVEDEILKNQKLESLGLLAGGIAHDFNNALAAMLANVQMIQLSLTKGKDVTKHLNATENSILKTANLTKQLLAFARGGIPVRKVTAIPKLVQDTVNFALQGSNVKADYFFGEGLWLVNIDEGQIGQVINNLTLNAIQAMPEGGTIKVSGENLILTDSTVPLPEGKYLKITITDHGIGIPPENLTKVFDPYFTTKITGTGLGLATSFTIIKRHDGYITIDSTPGTGTEVTIFLPSIEESNATSELESFRSLPGTGKVLIMDDEEKVREVIGELLRNLGYTVELARDGSEAVKMYEEAIKTKVPFSVVIMDLTIPGGMGGIEVLSQLLKIDPETKAIISSGYSNSTVMADYQRYGFHGVLVKPYKIEDLSMVLHQVLTN